ncbi:5-enol-pyruvylshikimate-phosphate synthase 1C [Gossypium australe]|uniref:5-enol-pyruvylshikimate-phosphate synthase 1C n=1 Tax=Gossypium australe TaxID=47621 RepID=A0A5B6UY58_9ROSI|nr:5-enol-pyruvylshikimate-phosphate synthase 1C [Gossypium australe]
MAQGSKIYNSTQKTCVLPKHVPSVTASEILIQPINEISGTVTLPGSKSFSHRILLLATLSEGTTVVDNLLNGDDIHYMLVTLKKLGVYILDGIPQMRKRTIEDLVTGLKQLGVDIDCTLGMNCPPVYINGKGGLPGGKMKLSGSISSLYLSVSFMSTPLAHRDVEIEIIDRLISSPYIEMTTKYPRYAYVEDDASSASYFLAGAAVMGGTVTVEGCGTSSLQTETSVTVTRPPRNSSRRKHLCAIDVKMNKMPDVAMTLAVVALYTDGPTAIRDGIILNMLYGKLEGERDRKDDCYMHGTPEGSSDLVLCLKQSQ